MESPWELGDWVPEALLRTSSISVRVSTRFPSCKRWLFARKFALCSRLHPGAALPGSFLRNALCRQSPELLHESFFLNWDFPWTLRPSPSASGSSTPCTVLVSCRAVVLPTPQALGDSPLPPSPVISGGWYLCPIGAEGNMENQVLLYTGAGGVGKFEVPSVRYRQWGILSLLWVTSSTWIHSDAGFLVLGLKSYQN